MNGLHKKNTFVSEKKDSIKRIVNQMKILTERLCSTISDTGPTGLG